MNWDDTIEFTLPVSHAYVIKVYDGDTITVACKLPYDESPVYRFRVRLRGINAPEMNGDKEKAIQSRDVLSELVLHKTVELRNVSIEKYGRQLADVYVEDMCVNEILLEKGVCVPYLS